MPSNERKNKGVYLELPQDLLEQTRALAASIGRPWTAEVIHALRRHLAVPPELAVPQLPQAAASPEASKRGRPRKGA